MKKGILITLAVIVGVVLMGIASAVGTKINS